MWYNNSTIKNIIEEIAEEQGLTPDDVLGVLLNYFNSIIEGSKNSLVKFFRLRGLGSFSAHGYKSRLLRTIDNKNQEKKQKKRELQRLVKTQD